MSCPKLFLSLFFVFLLVVSSTQKPIKEAPALFIFGDSYLDAGNNNYIDTSPLDQANFWPYGETHFGRPTGRFSDGRIIPDYLGERFDLPDIAPYLQPGFRQYRYGVNFASGGAGALSETFKGYVIDLKSQLNNFKNVANILKKENGENGKNGILTGAVFLLGVGANDYFSQMLANSSQLKSSGLPQYVGLVVGNLTQVIKEIYATGGRRFAVMNLQPLSSIPAIRILDEQENGTEASTTLKLLASLHNRALSDNLVRLRVELSGFKYALLDINGLMEQIIRSPLKYGFKHGISACCGGGKYRGIYSCGGKRPVKEFELCEDPSNYVFWDSTHLTDKAYGVVAAKMLKKRSRGNHGGSMSLRQLFLKR